MQITNKDRGLSSVLCRQLRKAAVFALAAACANVPAAQAELVAAPAINNVAPVQQQFRGAFEPILKVELSFVNRVCKPSDEQRKNLIVKSNNWLTKFIEGYAAKGGQPQMQGVWFGGAQPQVPDARESIRDGVKNLVRVELSKEQSDAYIAESKKRSDFAKQAVVANLVSRIDKEVNLSPEQRRNVSKSLNAKWDKSWAPQMEMFMHGMDMVPNVPDQLIRPHLSATQQAAWNRIHKQTGTVFFGGMGNEGQVIDDVDLHEFDEKADEAPPQPAAAVLLPVQIAN